MGTIDFKRLHPLPCVRLHMHGVGVLSGSAGVLCFEYRVLSFRDDWITNVYITFTGQCEAGRCDSCLSSHCCSGCCLSWIATGDTMLTMLIMYKACNRHPTD